MEDYKPDVELHYVDKQGNKLTPKEVNNKIYILRLFVCSLIDFMVKNLVKIKQKKE